MPEARAELVLMGDRWFKVLFSGSFCYSCGVYDYLDDLRVLLEDFGLKTRIERFEEEDDGLTAIFIIEGGNR